MSSTDLTPALEQRAHQRARRKLGWYLHALVYLAVNLLLVALSASAGRHWALYPALGWGLGLALHGIVVWTAAPGGRLYAHLLQRERDALDRGRAAAPR